MDTGTFITRDPLGFVDGPNMYAYVVQNPWTKFDPEGLAGSGPIIETQGPQVIVEPNGSIRQRNATDNAGFRFGRSYANGTVGTINTMLGGNGKNPTERSRNQLNAIFGPVNLLNDLFDAASGQTDAGTYLKESGQALKRLATTPEGLGDVAAMATLAKASGKLASIEDAAVINAKNKAAGGTTTLVKSAQQTLGETTLRGVDDNMMVHFGQIANEKSFLQNGVQSQGGLAHFFRAGDVKNLTPSQVKGAIGDLAQGGAEASAAVVVAPNSAKFTKTTTQGMTNYTTEQPSVPVQRVIPVDEKKK